MCAYAPRVTQENIVKQVSNVLPNLQLTAVLKLFRAQLDLRAYR